MKLNSVKKVEEQKQEERKEENVEGGIVFWTLFNHDTPGRKLCYVVTQVMLSSFFVLFLLILM